MREKKLSDAIFSVAWGYILVHLHFNVGAFDLLPDWLAYILFYNAINVIGEKEPSAKSLQPLAVVLGLWDVINIFVSGLDMFSVIIAVLSLYFHFQFLTNIANIAAKNMCLEETNILRLRTVRTVLITIFAIPINWNEWVFVTYILLIANIVVAICICKELFSLRKSLQIRELSAEME